ncbi:hypothetical protein Emed_003675 [Eimeria media]
MAGDLQLVLLTKTLPRLRKRWLTQQADEPVQAPPDGKRCCWRVAVRKEGQQEQAAMDSAETTLSVPGHRDTQNAMTRPALQLALRVS